MSEDKRCLECGRLISPSRSHYCRIKYCSKQCKAKYYVKDIGNVKIVDDHTQMGRYSELLVCCDLIKKGWFIFLNTSPSSPFDIVAYKNKYLLKVEVKTGFINSATGTLTYAQPRNKEYQALAVYVKNNDKVQYLDISGKEVRKLEESGVLT